MVEYSASESRILKIVFVIAMLAWWKEPVFEIEMRAVKFVRFSSDAKLAAAYQSIIWRWSQGSSGSGGVCRRGRRA